MVVAEATPPVPVCFGTFAAFTRGAWSERGEVFDFVTSLSSTSPLTLAFTSPSTPAPNKIVSEFGDEVAHHMRQHDTFHTLLNCHLIIRFL